MTSADGKVLRIPMKDHLRNSSLPTDVSFVVPVYQGESAKQTKHVHDVVFAAHRERLLSASPYFESLLAGDWKHVDEVSIEDCQPGAFRILLRCLNYLDKNAAALTKRPSFLRISHERLMKILARCSLGIHEIDLYRAATKWARAQLKRANKRPTDQAVRDDLGKALLLVRFPTMHPQEFKSSPAKDNILSAKEKLAIYDRIHDAGPTACAFSAEPRTGPSTLPLRHFKPTYCQTCGARLTGDACPECGCSYQSSVECAGCGKRTFVDAKAFVWDMCFKVREECYAAAFRCSCGAPNTTENHGRVRCRRCGLELWLCTENDKILEESCKCNWCRDVYREDYSDYDYADDEEGADAY